MDEDKRHWWLNIVADTVTSIEPAPLAVQRMVMAMSALQKALNELVIAQQQGIDLPYSVNIHMMFGDNKAAMASVSLHDVEDEEDEEDEAE